MRTWLKKLDPIPRAITPKLPVAQDRSHFWYYDNDGATALVFIHGIFANSLGCWSYVGNDPAHDVYWPDLIIEDERFETPAIYMAGYPSYAGSGDLGIDDAAAIVWDALRSQDVAGHRPVLERRNIIFVAHSMGGAVTRQMLVEHQDDLQGKKLGLVLLASPSLGSPWADRTKHLSNLFNNRLTQQLATSSTFMLDLHARFSTLLESKRLLLLGREAYEHQFIMPARTPRQIWQMLPNRSKIVNKSSAGLYFGTPRLLENTNHFSICKPSNLQHPSHEFLVQYLRDFAADDKSLLTAADEPRPLSAPED